MVEVTTDRLLLREFRVEDCAAVHALASDPAVARYTAWGPLTLEETAQELRAAVRSAQEVPRVRHGLAVVERASGAVIGSVELRVVSARHRRGQLDCALARSSWSKGYATEAGRALLDLAFDELGLHKLTATCDPRNTGSRLVLEKVGMQQEGYLRDHVLVGGAWQDRLLFGLVASARDGARGADGPEGQPPAGV